MRHVTPRINIVELSARDVYGGEGVPKSISDVLEDELVGHVSVVSAAVIGHKMILQHLHGIKETLYDTRQPQPQLPAP